MRLGRTGRTAAACVYGVSTSQTSRLDELVSGKNYSRCRVITKDVSWSACCVKRGLYYLKHVEMASKERMVSSPEPERSSVSYLP